MRARKFFLDNIAKKINSDIDEEKMKGLCAVKYFIAVSLMFMTVEILLILFQVYKSKHCS